MKEIKENYQENELMSDKELDEIDENFKRVEIEGIQNILKYFDRIHDKLFHLNNILIGGFFILSQIYDFFSVYGIIIPLINLGILLFIEYRMMNKSRFEANVRNKTKIELQKHTISINRTNFYSLLSILTTATVVIIFIYHIFSININKQNSTPNKKEIKLLPQTVNPKTSKVKIFKPDTI